MKSTLSISSAVIALAIAGEAASAFRLWAPEQRGVRGGPRPSVGQAGKLSILSHLVSSYLISYDLM